MVAVGLEVEGDKIRKRHANRQVRRAAKAVGAAVENMDDKQFEDFQNAVVEQVRVRVLPDGRMSREDAAKYLGLKSRTLSMWALAGKGPKFTRVGGRVFYLKSDLDAFIRGEL